MSGGLHDDRSNADLFDGALEDTSDTSNEIILGTSLLPFCLQLGDASASLVLADIGAADQVLTLSHAGVDVDVARFDPQWAIFRPDEPAVALPAQVEEDEQRTGEVEFEEGTDDQVRPADWI